MGNDDLTLQKLVLRRKGAFDKDSVALQSGKRKITYEEFDELTDKIALNLIKAGCKPGNSVIVRLERSIEMVLSMFAVMKTGAAFVPVVLSVPEKRLESIKKNLGNPFTIDEDSYLQLVNNFESYTGDITSEVTIAEKGDPAMILFTSGSTGEPKGVVHNQASVGFLFDQFPNNLKETGIVIDEFDTVIARMSYGFAVAYHYEYGPALLNGKRLIILPEEEGGSIEQTCRILEGEGKFCITFIPSQLKVFLENERFRRAITSVACFCFHSEPVSSDLREKLKSTPDFSGSLIALYGMTESFGIAWQDVRANREKVCPPSVCVRVIDEDGRFLSEGEKGQLVVSSPTLFDEFLLTDAIEAKKLFEEKNITLEGHRYMLTGDVGVINEGGGIELTGRADRMVKYHGLRIELPEIELLMKNSGQVRKCCVVVGHTDLGTELLCAYYEGINDKKIDEESMRLHLKSKLPAYMIPVCFKHLEKLPINEREKIDYKYLSALPVEVEQKKHNTRELTVKERMIAEVTSSLLKIDISLVGPETNLFSIGIDSLNAVVIIGKLESFGYCLTLDDFINSTSVEELAKKLKCKSPKVIGDDHQKKDISKLVRCTDMQQSWIENNLQVVTIIKAHKGIDEEELKAKMQQFEVSHPAFRSTFIEMDAKWHTKVLKKRPIRWEYSDLREIADESGEITDKQKRFIMLKFDLLQGQPNLNDLMFVNAVRISENQTVFLIRVDHRVVDAISLRILIRELLSEGQVVGVDNYINYLEATADEKTRLEACSFWKDYLAGVTIPDVPKNQNPSGVPKYNQYHIVMQGDNEKQIRGFCRLNRVSLPAFILSQYALTILDVLKLQDTIINVAVSGRTMKVDGLKKDVGCIVNTVPVRVKATDSAKDFMNSCLQVDGYSFLNAEDIYASAFGKDEVPDLLPFVTSEILPKVQTEVEYERIQVASFENYNRGNFLWEDEKGIHLMLHPDVDKWDEKTIDEIARRTKARLTNF